MFLEFNSGHFGTKMESLRPSYQKLGFYHIWAWAWSFGHVPHLKKFASGRILILNINVNQNRPSKYLFIFLQASVHNWPDYI